MKKISIITLVSLGVASAEDVKVWLTGHMDLVAGYTATAAEHGHGHDPKQDRFIQGSDYGINFEAYGWLSGFANVNVYSGDHELKAEWEEGFLNADLSSGFSFKAGRYLNNIGTQNFKHLHSWDYIDSNAAEVRYLGEEGLASEGAELTWSTEYERGFFAITSSYGQVVEHSHEEEGDDHEEEGWNDTVSATRALLSYNHSDFIVSALGVNYVTSADGDDRNLNSYDYTATWRENGLEDGGKELALVADYQTLDTSEADFNGYRFAAKYGFGNGFSVGARYEWGEFHEEEKVVDAAKYSVMAAYQYTIDEDWRGRAKVQFNTDSHEGDLNNAVWFQLGFSYGDAEVR